MNTLYRFNKNKKVGLLNDLKIDEVSFCMKGANPGAKINLFKSALAKEAATFSEIFVDPEVREAKEKASNSFFTMLDALFSSINRIAFDSEISQKERKAMMDKSINEFTSVFSNKIRDDLTKAKGDSPMNYEELLKLLGLKDVSADVEKTLKSMVANQATIEEAQKQIAEMKKQLEELSNAPTQDPAPTPHLDDPIAKAKAEGASEEVIKLLKQVQDDKAALEKKVEASDTRVSKLEEQNVRKECMQSATVLSFIEKAADLSDILYDLKKAVTPELYAKVEKLLEGANAKLKESNLFKVAGSDGENSLDSVNDVVAKAEKLAAERVTAGLSKTKEQAMVEVWKTNPDLRKAYDERQAEIVRAR